jgi:hypothetical protein
MGQIFLATDHVYAESRAWRFAGFTSTELDVYATIGHGAYPAEWFRDEANRRLRARIEQGGKMK